MSIYTGSINLQGEIYTGSLKNGWTSIYPEGQGTKTYFDGSVYKGQWTAGQRDGLGMYTSHPRHIFQIKSDVYFGEWKNDLFHGEGTMEYGNGDIYDGGWIEGMRAGFGSMIYANGDTYTGQWKEDQWEGEGTLTNSSGDRFTGEWSVETNPSLIDGPESLSRGRGIVFFANGRQFEGTWIYNGTVNSLQKVSKNHHPVDSPFLSSLAASVMLIALEYLGPK